jgi:hypothetical protein
MILHRLVVPVSKLPIGEVRSMFMDLVIDPDNAYVITVAVGFPNGDRWEARVGWPKEFYLKDKTNMEFNYYCRRDEDYESVAKYGMTLPERQARQLFETELEYYHA